mmetsp:Transcript_104012/g.127088  ORF Transcript_104012/g.127088 Transcript_104012/m.127088 type:complete len:87 (+) Transcript_104012:74-334(+)
MLGTGLLLILCVLFNVVLCGDESLEVVVHKLLKYHSIGLLMIAVFIVITIIFCRKCCKCCKKQRYSFVGSAISSDDDINTDEDEYA